MKIFYMNQGGGGEWPAISYRDYDLLLCAEGTVVKQGFEENYNSKTTPPMQVQVKTDAGRIFSSPTDLDVTVESVRPMVAFQLKGLGIWVVFVHLKSASEKYATEALELAAGKLKVKFGGKTDIPVLWIGDFNRADVSVLKAFDNFQVLQRGGGQSKWDLDGAIITGSWTAEAIAEVMSTSSDHGHIGIKVAIG